MAHPAFRHETGSPRTGDAVVSLSSSSEIKGFTEQDEDSGSGNAVAPAPDLRAR
jgi:hypothetical protein